MSTVTIKATYSKVPTATEDGVLGVSILCDPVPARAIHIGLVLDTSGSMEGERIAAVKKTLSVLIDRLSVGDMISVVGFSTTAQTLFSAIRITNENKSELITKVNQLHADGGTNMELGITAMGTIFKDGFVRKQNAVALLTDGQVNEGIATTGGLASLLRSYLGSVPIYTLGYGSDHNVDLLRSISSRTQATYTYITNEIVLPNSIGDLLGGLQNEVASSAAIHFPSTWTCLEQNSVSGSNYEMGSLIAEKPTWVMFKVPAGTTADSGLSLHFTRTGDSSEVVMDITIDSSLDRLDVVEQELRCATATTLNEVTELLKRGQLERAKITLTSACELLTLSEAASRSLVIRMKAQIEEMLEEADRFVLPRTPGRLRHAMDFTPMVMRTSSTAQNYGAQRGVTSMAPALFSSPTIRRTTQAVVSHYSQIETDQDDPHANVTPVASLT